MIYQDRIVVYIDILGFKKLIEDTIDANGIEIPEKTQLILDTYKRIRETWDLDVAIKENRFGHELYESQGKEITMFSDLIVVSFLQNAKSGIWLTLYEISLMVADIAFKGMFCRGMVTYGKIYHNDTKIFGPALVEAYIGETKAALYPRIILSNEIIEIAKKSINYGNSPEEEEKYILDLLKIDTDGMYYIDYFSAVSSSFDDPSYGYADYLSVIKMSIQEGLKIIQPDIRIKFMWLKERYNEAVKNVHNKIEYFKANGDFEMAELCEQVQML